MNFSEIEKRISTVKRLKLKHLDLSNCFLEYLPFELAEIGSRIEYLDISTNCINAKGISLIDIYFPNLVNLNLGTAFGTEPRNEIGDFGLSRICKIVTLKELDVKNCNISDKGTEELLSLSNLLHLDIRYNGITQHGAENISRLVKLEVLDISDNKIEDKGGVSLSGLANIKRLDLRYTNIGDEAAIAISSIPKLEHLDLRYNGIGDRGLKQLQNLIF